MLQYFALFEIKYVVPAAVVLLLLSALSWSARFLQFNVGKHYERALFPGPF